MSKSDQKSNKLTIHFEMDKRIAVIGSLLLIITCGALIGSFGSLFPDAEKEVPEFFRNLIVTILSLVIGIPIALSVNEIWNSSQRYEDRKELLQLLRLELGKNVDLLRLIAFEVVSEIERLPSRQVQVDAMRSSIRDWDRLIANTDLHSMIDISFRELCAVDRAIQHLSVLVHKPRTTFDSEAHFRWQSYCYFLRSYNEMFHLAQSAEARFNKAPDDRISREQAQIIQAKFGVVLMTVGITNDDIPRTVDTVFCGGAVKLCRDAVRAINSELSLDPGETCDKLPKDFFEQQGYI